MKRSIRTLYLPNDIYWELENQLHRLEQEKIKHRSTVRLSLSILMAYSIKFGIETLKKANIDDVVNLRPPVR